MLTQPASQQPVLMTELVVAPPLSEQGGPGPGSGGSGSAQLSCGEYREEALPGR